MNGVGVVFFSYYPNSSQNSLLFVSSMYGLVLPDQCFLGGSLVFVCTMGLRSGIYCSTISFVVEF